MFLKPTTTKGVRRRMVRVELPFGFESRQVHNLSSEGKKASEAARRLFCSLLVPLRATEEVSFRQWPRLVTRMAFFKDLDTETQIASGPHVRAIGWLALGEEYSKG